MAGGLRQPRLGTAGCSFAVLLYLHCSERYGVSAPNHGGGGLFRGVRSDAEVIGAPAGDGLLDLLGGEVFAGGADRQRVEFGVGGEAEGDELPFGEGVDEGVVGGRKKRGKAEALFEPDEPILGSDGGAAGDSGEHKESEGHDDPPEEERVVPGPVVDSGVDREDEVEDEDGNQDEVEGWIVAGVIAEALRLGHGPFPSEAGFAGMIHAAEEFWAS